LPMVMVAIAMMMVMVVMSMVLRQVLTQPAGLVLIPGLTPAGWHCVADAENILTVIGIVLVVVMTVMISFRVVVMIMMMVTFKQPVVILILMIVCMEHGRVGLSETLEHGAVGLAELICYL
jgi:hypothetical protein